MKQLFLALVITLFAVSTAFSYGVVENAKITKIRVDSNGYGMIFFDKVIWDTTGQRNSCIHSVYLNAFGFNTNTAGGKAILSWAIAAKALGKSVIAFGLGNCNIYGPNTVESFNYAETVD